jgi:hypothetical protein
LPQLRPCVLAAMDIFTIRVTLRPRMINLTFLSIRLYGALCLSARLQELWKFTDCLEEPVDGIPNDTDQTVTSVLPLRFFITRWFVLFSKIINQDY